MDYEIGIRMDAIIARIDLLDKKVDFILGKFQKADELASQAEAAAQVLPDKTSSKRTARDVAAMQVTN